MKEYKQIIKKSKQKKWALNVEREKSQVIYKGRPIRITPDVQQETLEERCIPTTER